MGNYKNEFFHIGAMYLIIHGIYPWKDTRMYVVYKYVASVIIVCFVAFELLYHLRPSPIDATIENLSVTFVHIMGIYRVTNMFRFKKPYGMLMDAMENSEYFNYDTDERKKIIKEFIRRNKNTVKMIVLLTHCTLITWYVFPLMDSVPYNMPLTVRVPGDWQCASRYPLVYIPVLIGFHYVSMMVITNDMFMVSLLSQFACQLNILANCFENLYEDSRRIAEGAISEQLASNRDPYGARAAARPFSGGADDFDRLLRDIYTVNLKNCVKQHIYLYNNARILNELMSGPMFAQWLISGLLICLSGYTVTATFGTNLPKLISVMFYLLYTLSQLFFVCGWCDDISVESFHISQAVYFSTWLDDHVPAAHRRSLALVAHRAQRRIEINAAGIYNLTLESYTNLVKTSYTALTVLLRMRKD